MFADAGTGKTRVVLEVLQATAPWPALILCPKSVVRHAWLKDHERFGARFALRAAVGTRTERVEVLRGVVRGSCQAIVTNYDTLRHTPELFRVPWRCVVLDESTRIKAPSIKTTKLVHKLVEGGVVERVYALSGRPTPNHLLELWPQAHAVIPGALERTFYQHRALNYYQPSPYQKWLWVVQPSKKAEIYRKIQPYATWIRKEDCLDLPEQTFVQREVELSDRERLLYDDFVRELVVELEEGSLVGATAFSQLMTSRQILAGIARLRGQEDHWEEVGKSKLLEAQALLDELGDRPVILVGQFRKELERYLAYFSERRKAVLLYGGISDKDRADAIEGFQEGRYDLLVCHPKTMSHGLTFVSCADVVWASLSYSYEEFYQLNQRIHRIGQTKPCTYHLLIARKTIDEPMLRALGQKRDLGLEVLQEIARGARK